MLMLGGDMHSHERPIVIKKVFRLGNFREGVVSTPLEVTLVLWAQLINRYSKNCI